MTLRSLIAVVIFALLNTNTGHSQSTLIIRFETDSFHLVDQHLSGLDTLISGLEADPSTYRFIINGHTDNVGSVPYNKRLSHRRGEEVRKYLLSIGVDSKQIDMRGYGYDRPAMDNATDDGKEANRRVEITASPIILYPDWKAHPDQYSINAVVANTIRLKNGCTVKIDPHSFVDNQMNDVSGTVVMEITEYNEPADFLASGIPMSYTKNDRIFMFHSEKMFQVKAKSKGKDVYLKDGVQLILKCEGVDTLDNVGLYKFNLREQEWFELEKKNVEANQKEKKESEAHEPTSDYKEHQAEEITRLDAELAPSIEEKVKDEERQETKKKRTSASDILQSLLDEMNDMDTASFRRGTRCDIDREYYISQKLLEVMYCYDYCDSMEWYINLGIQLAHTGIDYIDKEIVPESYLSFDERYASFDYAGTEKLIVGTPEPSVIEIQTKKLFLRKKLKLHITADENRTMYSELNDISWIVSYKRNNRPSLSSSYRDMRVLPSGKKNNYRIELKSGRDFTIVDATLKRNVDANRKRIETFDSKVADTGCAFDKRMQEEWLDGYIREYMDDSRFHCLHCWYDLFLNYNNPKAYVDYDTWVKYFNTHLQEMEEKFGYVYMNRKSFREGLPCDTVKVLLEPGNQPILVIGLGLFNLDELIEVSELYKLPSSAVISESCHSLANGKIFLVVEGINGMMKLDKEIVLIKGYSNSLFIVGENNRCYKAVIDLTSTYAERPQRIICTDVTTQVQTLEGLRKVIEAK